MKLFKAFCQSRYPLAILSGLLLAISFPKIGLAGLAWMAPGLIILMAIGCPGKQTFRLGYVAFFTHYLASLYWLLLIPVRGFPILGWTALSAFLALFPAVWVWLGWRLFPIRINLEEDSSPKPSFAAQFFGTSWAQRLIWTLSLAALWVALEMLIARIFSGFPWNLLGSSQFKMIPVIQIASVTGIYGVSFVIVWASLSCLSAGMGILSSPARRSTWAGEIALPLLTIFLICAAGGKRTLHSAASERQVSIALIQPSIPQSLIWDSSNDYQRFQDLLQLSQKSIEAKPDIVIWPEAGVPGLIRIHKDISEPIFSFAASNKVWMVIGGDDLEPHPGAQTPQDSDFFNSSFLISPTGKMVESYKKRALVIFGEYIPLVKWLPFIKYFTPINSGFVAGKKVVPFLLPDLDAKLSVLICFEDVFPHLAREYVSDDTDFLVNITNDGWFGEGAAQWQHAAAATFRAVENGIPLVRCSNNGLTCWIDQYGRLQQIFERDRNDIYGPGYLLAKVPLLNRGTKLPRTFYRQHGDVFGWACVILSVFNLTQLGMRRRKQNNHI